MSKLIIQRTLNGLDTEYKSEGLNEHELERLGVLYDERKEIIQLNQFDWNISITNTATQKVISLIRKGNDRAGRAGFYAIRLFVAKGTIINGLFNYLQKIAARYVQHISQSTLNSQDYSDLLNEIDDNTQVSTVILTRAIFDKTCYKVVDYNQQLDAVLNDPILELVKKTYLFNRAEAINVNTFKEIGFTDFGLLENSVRKLHIENPDNFIASININNNSITTSNFGEASFQVYALNSEQVTIKDKFLKPHTVNSSPYTLKKPEPVAPVYSENHGYRGEKSSSGGVILIGIISLLIGAAGGYFLPKYFLKSEPKTVLAIDPLEHQEATSEFELKVMADKSQSFVLESNHSNLNNYTFKYDSSSKSWKVRKRSDDSKDDKLLTQVLLKEVLGPDSALIPDFLSEMEEIAPGSINMIENLKNVADSSNQNSTQVGSNANGIESNTKKKEVSTSNKSVKPTEASGQQNVKNSPAGKIPEKKEAHNESNEAQQ
ncbi:hypothetical protein [Sphingobacterium sp.]|uniref:hypothetical protein n=1 Tax=Sphingobacterium sp. TaxID=341027 RepID=UPI00289D0D2F|nr:hypothetical protein [Sphingobacterium sp.]